ncbi:MULTISPECIES: indole-3-glycerol phosphate synthase TrpC [Psychrobacter]|uniref:indole-3-glycerol phosphate synthase TrpC n=1 Tax=Psychrobacter TaxID=497 RepID=UPI00086C133D|nr:MULTISPECIES: indole-3-glycerol phosphate synthase TrpC [Psychrobacter]MBA6243132.1 indole-3-glycerol phosphate synthase TrpC [Psychrobacter sp. Urea-trap-18]MBA6286190.1 indole-3-glycerol phosphate synthase TrpC [Psychrobacter sp. Urea-trap-16]MBA6317339.1 indole-3-glycerol phosphate synthase TrpC [Psychrobacter sp. Urea-trap-20]MBA6334633.1 indole-3-glycerol phosphate synthase TrpC [Psychrobacter sp. Urea-trap-19]OEH68105.1 MAG: indole-3-glycerol-phosphate synthase [Psychrobacter sp. B29-|tara:strand:- start:20113 stop:20982 length:870 start_codon:yes stop_codon:yes gene_type:complete
MTTTHSDIPSVLQRIVATKVEEVKAAREALSLEDLKAQVAADDKPRRGFAAALRAAGTKENGIGIIAEIKKASPSKGIINHNFTPALFAQQYEQAGASCLSVLTDRDYFQGDDIYLIQAANTSSLPILRKDFMIDVYQIYQSYLMGADCILLIMACLDDAQVQELHALSIELGMDVLIEVHTQSELERALQLPRSEHNIYGINNRDLNTFDVDLQTTLDLKNILNDALATDSAEQKPLIVTESGIHSSDDIRLMLSNDIQHFLIGEQFMKTDHPGQALQSLLAGVAADG